MSSSGRPEITMMPSSFYQLRSYLVRRRALPQDLVMHVIKMNCNDVFKLSDQSVGVTGSKFCCKI